MGFALKVFLIIRIEQFKCHNFYGISGFSMWVYILSCEIVVIMIVNIIFKFRSN